MISLSSNFIILISGHTKFGQGKKFGILISRYDLISLLGYGYEGGGEWASPLNLKKNPNNKIKKGLSSNLGPTLYFGSSLHFLLFIFAIDVVIIFMLVIAILITLHIVFLVALFVALFFVFVVSFHHTCCFSFLMFVVFPHHACC